MKSATIFALLLTLFMVGCAGEPAVQPAAPQESAATLPSSPTPSPTDTLVPTVTAEATATPVMEATREPLPSTATQIPEPEAVLEATEQPPASPVVSGQTEEGAYFYGDPAAAVTLIDYSDFL